MMKQRWEIWGCPTLNLSPDHTVIVTRNETGSIVIFQEAPSVRETALLKASSLPSGKINSYWNWGKGLEGWMQPWRPCPGQANRPGLSPLVIYPDNRVNILPGLQPWNSFSMVVWVSPGPYYMSPKTHLFAEMLTIFEFCIGKIGGSGPGVTFFNFPSFLLLFYC